MPLISVIIPVYNGEKTIRETIESVCHQTLSDWEIIAIDDGSQDATLETLSSIQDPRLKVFSYPNAGQAASRNRGLALASGKYISFLDADDLWTADKLESQLKALQENPEASVAYSWVDCIDESGQFSRRGSHLVINGDVYANMLLVYFLENGSNPLIKREAIDRVGGFDESLPPAEDWDFWLRVAALYHFVAVPATQILYRLSFNSESSNVLRMEKSASQVIQKAFAGAPASLQYLRNPSFGNIYKYLTSKALEGKPNKQHILTAARLLGKAIQYDRSLLFDKVVVKVLLKIAAIAILPPKKAQALFAANKIFNTTTILCHIRRDI